jgi:hypothetical protein
VDHGVIQPARVQPLQLPTGRIAPKHHREPCRLEINLDARTAAHGQAALAIDFRTPTSYNTPPRSTSTTRKGQEVALTYYFQQVGHRHLARLHHSQRHAAHPPTPPWRC